MPFLNAEVTSTSRSCVSNSPMAIRNLTAIFLDSRHRRTGGPGTPAEHTIGLDDDSRLHLALAMCEGTPPAWVEMVDRVREIDATIKEQLPHLRGLQDARLEPRFGKDDEAEEREIRMKNSEVRQLLRQGVVAIGGFPGNEGNLGHRPWDEQKLLNNVQIDMFTRLSVTSQKYQEQHRKFVSEQKACVRRHVRMLREKGHSQEEIDALMGNERPDAEGGGPERDRELEDIYGAEQDFDQGLSREQIAALMVHVLLVPPRDWELQHIQRTIPDVRAMFQDLPLLVIDMGTVSDRIDCCIEETEGQFQRRAGRRPWISYYRPASAPRADAGFGGAPRPTNRPPGPARSGRWLSPWAAGVLPTRQGIANKSCFVLTVMGLVAGILLVLLALLMKVTL